MFNTIEMLRNSIEIAQRPVAFTTGLIYKNGAFLKLLLLILITELALMPLSASAYNQTYSPTSIPIEFTSNVDGDKLMSGAGITVRVAGPIEVNGKLLFNNNCRRKGVINISRGVLYDIYGKQHQISVSGTAYGKTKLRSVAGALSTSGMAIETWKEFGGGISGVLFASGVSLIPIAFALGRGEHAVINKGQVLYATLVN
jgi:hypothetical protein